MASVVNRSERFWYSSWACTKACCLISCSVFRSITLGSERSISARIPAILLSISCLRFLLFSIKATYCSCLVLMEMYSLLRLCTACSFWLFWSFCDADLKVSKLWLSFSIVFWSIVIFCSKLEISLAKFSRFFALPMRFPSNKPTDPPAMV